MKTPALWKFSPCGKHIDFDPTCPACVEELATIRTDKAWQNGFQVGLEVVRAPQPEDFTGHRLVGIICDHERKEDTAQCECSWSRNFTTIGAAFDGWLAHARETRKFKA